MWAKISSFIIRNRLLLLVLLALGTAYMGYHAQHVQLSYSLPQVIPVSDPDYQEYEEFKEQYGSDGNYIVIGMQPESFFEHSLFNEWYELEQALEAVDGIRNVTSINDVLNIHKDSENRSFRLKEVVGEKPRSQAGLDSLKRTIQSLPFYKGLFYNPSTEATYMAVELEKDVLTSKERTDKIDLIIEKAKDFGKTVDTEVHYSGIPFIRTKVAEKVEKELKLFSLFAVLMTALFLLIFFRSLYAVVFPLIVITIVIISVLGTIVLLDYRITLLSGLIPPLIVIIGMPNFIYFLNKYHNEYHKHGNKMRAITRMVQKIGIVIFLTNVTTAIGFGVLTFTDSPVLQEFGIVAAINVVVTFFVSIISIPAVFSILPEPSSRQTKYLNSKGMQAVLTRFSHWVINHRKTVYAIFLSLTAFSVIGLTQLKAVGYILDDIPQGDKLQKDLDFFENHFNGIMPFEILVNTGKPNGLRQISTLEDISQFQDSLSKKPYISRSMSPVDFIKFGRQAFHGGDEERYGLPSSRERSFLTPYLRSLKDTTTGFGGKLADSNQQTARITTQIEDIGSIKLERAIDNLNSVADSIFSKETQVTFTGVSLIFLKKNAYLIQSLLKSLALAFCLVSIIMGFLFARIRMIVVSLLPNFIPLLLTAGLMGFLNIPFKPSSVLIFSIAFGISVDDALHFLVKYRQELKNHDWDMEKTVQVAISETGTSMIYTSLVLFFGFAMFYPSTFGGTSSLGALTSTTLLIAMFTNLILLPSLILTFDQKKANN